MKKKVVEKIQELVYEIKQENNIINEIIRDDVFSILQACNCTVLYFPLEGESEEGCAGCHLNKPVNGKIEQFVFINTNNTRERQAFSAAHELGHIWRVDERIKQALPEEEIDVEDVINRFAAELLMPEELFLNTLKSYLKKIEYKGPNIKKVDLIKVAAYMMNYFFVPFKSVIFRFNELELLDSNVNEAILPYKGGNLLKEIIKAEQYTRLGIINKLKSLDNLQDYLAEAEEKGLINPIKVENIKECFEIEELEEGLGEDVKF